MGDRTTTYLPCPKCGKESEQYDAPSCLMWVWICDYCKWKDDRNYYETSENTIELITEKEAKKRKLDYVDGLLNSLLDKKPNWGK